MKLLRHATGRSGSPTRIRNPNHHARGSSISNIQKATENLKQLRNSSQKRGDSTSKQSHQSISNVTISQNMIGVRKSADDEVVIGRDETIRNSGVNQTVEE